MKRSLTQKLGLLGVVSFLSYTAAVVFAPLTYPGYNWMAQAVSDLSAANAPSLALWNQLSALYNACEVVCATVVCIGIQGQKTKLLRSGIYLFAIMEWISAVGYRMFPLSSSGYAGAFQDVMHMVTTALVVLLSIVSLTMIIVAGAKSKNCRSYGVCAAVALAMMLVGAMGMKIVPAEYFGVVERFSVFAATGFNAALGIHLFCMKPKEIKEYLHFILEQLSDLDDISYRPMMGEFILYYRGKIVGGIYDDRLLVKKTRSALELMPAAICELPYEGAKEMLLVDEVDSKVFLTELFEAMFDELPSPKRKNNGIGGITDELYSDHKRKY